MKSFKTYIAEAVTAKEKVNFTNWVRPSDKDIELEYKIEYETKSLKSLTNNAFPTVEDFKKAVKAAKVITVTPELDKKIAYRSGTRTKQELLSLIRSYASYPQYRNEKTLDAIYDGFRDGKPMKMPLIVKFPNGSLRIMSGNTRMDIAMQLGVTPKALLIEIPSKVPLTPLASRDMKEQMTLQEAPMARTIDESELYYSAANRTFKAFLSDFAAKGDRDLVAAVRSRSPVNVRIGGKEYTFRYLNHFSFNKKITTIHYANDETRLRLVFTVD